MKEYEIKYTTYIVVEADEENVNEVADQELINKIKEYGVETFVRDFTEISSVTEY